MKFNQHRLALAAASTAGIFYAVKAALSVVFPQFVLKMHAQFMNPQHAEYLMHNIKITPMGFVACFAHAVICTYLAVWLFAYLFNQFEKEA